MKRLAAIIFVLALTVGVKAQDANLFKGTFYNAANKITLKLDPDSASIEVPGLSFLGGTNGFMRGGIVYGVWVVTKCSKTDKGVSVRLTNDFGADTQQMTITHAAKDTFNVELEAPVYVKQVVKKKLVKISPKYTFVKI